MGEEKGLGKPKVSLQFELSSSGTTSLVKAEAVVEEKYTIEVEVEDEDEEATETSSNDTSASDTENSSEETGSKSESNETATDNETKGENEKKKTHRKTLEVESYHVGKIQPLSKDLIEEY